MMKKKAPTRKPSQTKAKRRPRETAVASRAQVEVRPAKGRPMLTWVGKRPLSRLPAFPAQHVETFDPTGELGRKPAQPDLWADWPAAYPKSGLLFHGDNKEVLAHLLANGFRGKVKLIYIDPPFDSGADYVRKVTLRGPQGTARLDGEAYALGEQVQYTDIWANDNYLQFMFERLLLLNELLSADGLIYLHADPKRNYQLRFLLDEVFGADAFRNEIVWWYWNKMQGNINRFASNHDTILCYQKGNPVFHAITEERPDVVRQLKRVWDPRSGSLVNVKDKNGSLVYIERAERTLDDVWRFSMLQPADETENVRFPTQKPMQLLEAMVHSSSDPGDIVLDCFMGSGTAIEVAQALGRRWIGCDINKGAIQTAAKRLQTVIVEQVAVAKEGLAGPPSLPGLEVKSDAPPRPVQLAFTTWRVNDYDLQIQHNEAVELACEHIGVERARTDPFFDGSLGRSLVKIIPFNHPLSPVDLDELRRELEARPNEDRPVTLVCLGIEMAAQAWIEDWNRLRKGKNAVNRIGVIELRTDPRYGKLIGHEPASARVKVARKKEQILVDIGDFISPSIIERLVQQAGLLKPKIDDWRAMVDCVMIDVAYDGSVFNVVLADIPEKRSDLVAGHYELPAPDGLTTVAVKVVDMLGEEVLVLKQV